MASAGTAYVDVEARLDSLESDISAAVESLSPEVSVSADTSDVDAALSSIEADPVDVAVGADTSDAEAAIESIDPPPIEPEVNLDTSGAEAQISELGDSLFELGGAGGEATGALDAFSGAALGAGSAGSIAATGGLAAIALGLGASVSNAMEAEVSLAQLELMVSNMGAAAGVTSAGLQEMATDLQKTAGFSDEAVMAGQSMVLMFENVRNVAGQPIFDRTIQSAADLARSPFGNGDIASSARTLGRALDNPSESFGRLARQGVTFTDSQQAAITAMQESGDMAGAQAALLDALEAKIGGAAAAYGQTLAGEVDRAKESIGEASEAIGATMIPVLGDLAMALGDVARAFAALDDASGGGLTNALAFGPALYGELKEAVSGTNEEVEKHGYLLGGLPPTLTTAIEAEREFTAAQQAANAAVANTLPTLGGVIGAVDRAGEAFGVLNLSSDPQVVIDNLGLMLYAWYDFQNDIDKIAGEGLSGPGAYFPRLAATLQQLGPEVASGLAGALADASPAVKLELDNLISQIEIAGGDGAAVLTGFAANGMAGAVGAVGAAVPGMETAGEAAGAAGASGIDAGLALTRAGDIGQLTGSAFGWGVIGGILAKKSSIDAYATEAITSAGDIFAAGRRGRAIGTAYATGVATGMASAPQPRAAGGPVMSGGRYLVGEQGPELFVPRTAGTVIPAQMTAALTSGRQTATGATYNITVNAPSGNGDDIARAISDELRKLERAGR